MTVKRPRLPRIPRPSSTTVEAAAVTAGFFGGLVVLAIGVGLIYLPAGLIAGGLLVAGCSAALARTSRS